MYSEFSKDTKAMVSTLVSGFDRKKVAYELKKTRRKTSGNIDMSRLAFYKTTDDIFKKRSVRPDGKSHGLYVMIDWSGSMRDRVESATRQAIILAKFAKKAGIDFGAYLFVGNYGSREPGAAGRVRVSSNLIEVISSKSSNATFENSCKALFNMGVFMGNTSTYDIAKKLNISTDHAYSVYQDMYTNDLGLSNTPLSESMINIYDVLSDRVRKNRIQNPNFVLISDGDCTGMESNNYSEGYGRYHGYGSGGQLIDPDTSKPLPKGDSFGEYSGRYKVTGAMMEKFRRSGFKTTTFFLTKHAVTKISNLHSIYSRSSTTSLEVSSKFKVDKKVKGILHIPGFAGCDNYYYISDKLLKSSMDDSDDLSSKDLSGATASQISKAMMTNAGQTTNQRFLASMLAEQIAEVYNS